MSKIAVLATLRAQPGKRDELVEAMRPMLDAVQQEAGTEIYVLHTREDEPDTVLFYELYSDQSALGAHSTSATMKAVGGALAGLLAGRPEIVQLQPVGGKGVSM